MTISCISLCMVFLLVATRAARGVLVAPEYEREALCDLYSGTNGGEWTWAEGTGRPWNCSGDSDPCADNWQGVYCTYISGTNVHVTYLELENYNLRGSLPSSLANLSQLLELDLTTNSLSGTIPLSLANLHKVTLIDLSENLLTGTIPHIFSGLSALAVFAVYNNLLEGTLPAEIFAAPLLDTLGVAYNMLHGTLPAAAILAATKLELFNIYSNRFTGTLPPELGSLPALRQIAASDNLFTHTIPSELARLSNCQYIGLFNNLFTGTIPDVFGNATQLHTLFISNNQLTGPIPQNLSLIQRLSVDNNLLTGSLPESITSWQDLTQLVASYNLLTGTLPRDIGRLQQLTFFYVNHNHIRGTIPDSLGSIETLVSLNLSYNALSGSIPRSFVALSNLNVLLLDHNVLTGSLQGLFNTTAQHNFTAIQVSNNQLTGQFPSDLFQLRQLSVLAAVGNCFSGTLPATICNSSSLVTLALDGLRSARPCRRKLLPGVNSAYTVSDDFAQTIPSCLFAMRKLRTLHLSGNGLTGALPDDGISPILTELSLSHNDLRGSIPSAFQHHPWTSLDLSYNRLGGSLHSDFTVISDNASLKLEQNRISGDIPATMDTVYDISILGSNLFACDATKDDLPHSNPDRDNYECGSTSFDAGAYTWLALSAMVGAAAVLLVRVRTGKEAAPKHIGATADMLMIWWNTGILQLPHYSHVSQTHLLLCRVAGTSAAAVILLLLPLYAVLSHYTGTLTHQYAWTVSAAYLAGSTPFAVLLPVYVLILCAFVALFLYFLRLRDDPAPPSHQMEHDARQGAQPKVVMPLTTHLLICIIFVTFNFVVVGGVNVAYVYVSLRASTSIRVLVQLLLSVFKLGFNRFCAPAFLRAEAEYFLSRSHASKVAAFSAADFVSVQLLVTLINNIAIPCVVVAMVSPSCFVGVFKAAPTVTSSFTYEGSCLLESQEEGIAIDCIQYTVMQQTTSYNPPFRYSYQCSSSVVTYYAPALVSMAIIATFVVPAGQALAQYLHGRVQPGGSWHRLLSAVVPRLLQPLPDPSTLPAPASVSYCAASLQLVSQLSHLGLLMTFGVVFPPLAVFLAVTIAASTAHIRLKVGRFLALAREQDRADCIAVIEAECRGVGSRPELSRAALMIVTVASAFYMLFLFDTLGDEVGFARAYWVLIVMVLLPIGLIVGHRLLDGSHWNGEDTGQGGMQNSVSATASDESVARARLVSTVAAQHGACVAGPAQLETLSVLHESL